MMWLVFRVRYTDRPDGPTEYLELGFSSDAITVDPDLVRGHLEDLRRVHDWQPTYRDIKTYVVTHPPLEVLERTLRDAEEGLIAQLQRTEALRQLYTKVTQSGDALAELVEISDELGLYEAELGDQTDG